MAFIHPTAVIEPGAQIAEGVTIGPMCYIGSKVTIGPRCRIVAQVAILGRTALGADNEVWPQAVLGADPQDLKYKGEDSALVVGDRNVIRELVTMHLGTANGGGSTRVGDDNLFMVGAHVAHDCIIGSHAILANNVGLSGHVHVEDYANVGGAVGSHHFVTIGQHAFVGGMTRLVHDVPPYMIVEGNPAEVRGVNVVGSGRRGFPEQSITRIKEAYRRLFRQAGPRAAGTSGGTSGGVSGGAGSLAARLAELEAEFPGDACIQVLVRFLRNSTAGVHGRHQETFRADSRKRKVNG